LRCVRGIDDLTALTIAAELGDARRFPSAPSVKAYMGLIPAEYSSGTRTVRGAITKTGNAHLRRVLVESAWHYRHHPFIGDALRHRQRGAPRASSTTPGSHSAASIAATVGSPHAASPNN
jgi:transposase